MNSSNIRHTVHLNLRLTPAQAERLEELSAQTKLTQSEVIRALIERAHIVIVYAPVPVATLTVERTESAGDQ